MRVDRVLNSSTEAVAHRIPPHPHLPLGASPCLPLPLLPPQPAPPPLWAQQAGNTSGSCGPTLGDTRAHEVGGFGAA